MASSKVVKKRTPPNAGKGRQKGTPNKATANARAAIAVFVDGNTERLQGWLDKIAETDGPKAAFQCLMDVMEYHVPKLARTEVTGKDGGELRFAGRIDVSELTEAQLEALAAIKR